MAIIQTAEGRSTGSVDSFGLAFDSNVGAGRLLVVCAGSYTQEMLAANMTDSLGHTYTRDRQDGATQRTGIFSTPNSTAGANTVTINTAANSYFSLVLYEISDMHASPVDQATGGSGAGSPGTGNFVPTADGLAIGYTAHASGTTALASDTGWTTDEEEEDATYIPYSAQSRTVTATVLYSCNWVSSSVNYAASVVTYKFGSPSGQPFVRRFGGVPHASGRISSHSW